MSDTPNETDLSAEDKQTLLHLARQTLNDYLSKGKAARFQADFACVDRTAR